MHMKLSNFLCTVNYIIEKSSKLKNKYTTEALAPVEFVRIFCQNEKEYEELSTEVQQLGTVVERTQSGYTYLLDKTLSHCQ